MSPEAEPPHRRGRARKTRQRSEQAGLHQGANQGGPGARGRVEHGASQMEAVPLFVQKIIGFSP